jgi:D-sedoheptulose 7-phosphate isomerase
MPKTVFTNGCFDILHAGHVDLLRRARELGTKLVVGLNSDSSVRAIKGPGRPVVSEADRKSVLEALACVDQVVIFEELTPEDLIKQIRPDVLVKGGDWDTDQIVGSDFVKSYGGEVHSLPLKAGHATSELIERIRGDAKSKAPSEGNSANRTLQELVEVLEDLISGHIENIEECGRLISATLHAGNKILICGNGGSAADAQHIAAELVGRFENERRAFPAIALTTDTSALTAISNDYGYERVFARQVESLATAGDCLIAISTSGNSPNILAAVMAARNVGCKVLGMTGAGGKKLAGLSDLCLMVPSSRTSHIQESHIAIAHIWCEMVDASISK